MTTLRCPSCGALGVEDRQFAADMLVYSQPQRRYACAMGHSWYLGVPEGLERTARIPPRVPGTLSSRPMHELVCQHCDTPFRSVRRRLYCSPVCTRIVDAARAKRRQAARPALTGEA